MHMTLPKSKSALLVSSAILLRQAGYDQKAIDILQEAIQEDPQFAPAYVLLGAFSQAVEQNDQAEAYFRKALTLEPENSEALQGFGLFLVSQERYAEALPYLEKHLKGNPDNSLSLDGLIESLHHLPGKEKQIRAALQKAWEVSKNPDLGIRYGRYLLDNGEPQNARNVLSAVVEVSKTPVSLAELALTCDLTHDCNCAIQLLQEAVEMDPYFDRGWRGLAQCYNEVKDFEKALEAAERAISINPKHYRNWQAKADVLLSLHKFENVLDASQTGIEIIRSLEEKEEAKPVWAVLNLQRFYAFLGLNRMDDALAEMARAREEMPDDPRFYDLSVQVLLLQNQPERALQLLDSVSFENIKNELAPLRYKTLHQLNHGVEAWNYILPYLEKNTEKRLNILADIGVQFYKRGLVEPAVAVYYQLNDFKPTDVRFATNLGYFLIGNGQLADAEKLLIQIIDCQDAGVYAEIARCNLAYIFNLTKKYKFAEDAFKSVLNSEFTKNDAFLRISFWVNGVMQPDPSPIPGRHLSLAECAYACAVSSALADGQIGFAESYAAKLQESSSNKPLTEMVFGCVEAAKGNKSKAAEFWNSAMSTFEIDSDRTALEEWLAQLS